VHRRGWLVALALIAGVLGCPRGRGPAPEPKNRPRLVVLVVVDQLAAWTFERDRALVRHGLARLLREGVYWPRAEYPYAYTYTAPGHAAIGTGTAPRASGIAGNSWYRRAEGVVRPAEFDPGAPVVFPPGTVPEETLERADGASGNALRVGGIADALRAARPASRSVAIALKARAACFVAGRQPDLVLWFEPPLGGFTTSTAYAPAVPGWVTELSRALPWSRFADAVWTAGDPALLARHTGIADDAPGEGGLHGLGVAFPHSLARSDEPVNAVQFTPFGDEMVADVAIAALDGELLGEDAAPDLLAVSFSSHDFVTHQWGQGSWEQVDMLLRLDLQLERLMTALDAKLGPDGYAMVLTSDHGGTPIVERSPHRGARRIPPDEIQAVAQQAMQEVLGPGEWVAAISALSVYLSPAVAAVPDAARRDAAIAAAIAAIRMVPGIADAGRFAPLAGGCPGGEAMAPLCASYVAGESGDIYLVPLPGSLVTEYVTGSHHDTPSEENRTVPVIVRAPGVAPRTVYQRVSMLRLARTIAELLGVPAPETAAAPALPLAESAR
jgi:hypothetical protein